MRLWTLIALFGLAVPTLGFGADDVQPRIEQVITTAGGEAKLLTKFRFRERVLITATVAAPPAPDEKENRTSVVEVGKNWWLGTNKRDKDKVRVLCWAWSLRLLLEPSSKVEALPEAMVAGKAAYGLRVTESVPMPITLHFDSTTHKLVAIDYTDTRHLFSEWKTTPEGHSYPSHVAGHRLIDAEKGTTREEQWYQTDILELTPLIELPEELK